MKFQDASNAISKLQSFLELFERAKTVLIATAAVEQEEDALRAKIESHKKELEGLALSIDAGKSELAKTAEGIATARTTAEEIIATARTQAAEFNESAKRKNVERSEALLGAVKKANQEIDAAREALNTLHAQIASAKQEYETLQGTIATLRDDARKRLG